MSITVKEGTYSYVAGQPLFTDISFSLTPGQIMAILGPNGVGKTTLLNCITGLLQWEKGETLLNEQPLVQMTERDIWKQIGYVPQARSNAFSYTVLDMVLLGRSTHLGLFETPSQEDADRALEILELLEIAHLASHSCNEISGGELQLVFIARALIAGPNILVLDEPESHLDFKKQMIILNVIEKLAHEQGISCIMNTHFPNNALRIADRVLMLGKHQPCLFGPVEDVLNESNLREYFEVQVKMITVDSEKRTFKNICPIDIVERGSSS
ncbi:ABC transporter ATP-binding protein [Bacillus sp. Hm123]|uniref:ABC transporter ATP-binding protein n=1 Tax=Bacillus sp. Hm123 TaxID=3450745 RepID=UPI003F4368DB